jgi:hypothetical protein
MKYTIAASHPKIQRRFKTLLSQELLQCFKSMTPKQVNLGLQILSSRRLGQRKWLRSEIDNDYELVQLLKLRVPDYKTKYPKIAEIASNLKLPTSDLELFNLATCEDYHCLFQCLITQYQDTVDKISDLAKKRVSFEKELDLAVNIGHMLLTMVKGKAFHMYLLAIDPTLVNLYKDYRMATEPRRLASKARQIAFDEREADEHEADQRKADQREADQRDADEREMESGSTLCPPTGADDRAISWEKVKSWIMLILVQLDAADALCEFVNKPELTQAEFDVKLVYSPLVSNEAISLEELFLGEYIPQPQGAEKTNAELLDIVKAANVRREQLKKLDGLINKWGKGRVSETKILITALSNQATKEDRQAGHGSEGDSPNTTISALCANITDILGRKPLDTSALLDELSALSEQLKEEQPLSFGEGKEFTGTLHCEAGLASILDQSTRGVIQARIKQLNAADPKDEQLHRCLSELLEQTQVGFFSVQSVPMVNPSSIHGGRASRESSGYQNAAAQCAVVFLPICHWMESAPAALLRQASTIPSRNAPYRNGPRNSSWIT